jgi:hypothetical protein
MRLRVLFLAACFACLPICCIAQDVQARAEALLQRARQLTDIRSPGSPAFRLKATFSFPGQNMETIQGTYNETWVTDSKWRREIVIGDMRHIVVGSSDRYWILIPDGFPQQADKLSALVTVFPSAPQEIGFASVSEHSSNGLSADCAYTKPVSLDLQRTFCFEKQTGLLMEEATPEKRPESIVRYSCGFRTFRKFGEHLFPREFTCFEDSRKTITMTVEDLVADPSPDTALLTPPVGSAEIGKCSGKVVPPRQTDWGLMLPKGAQILDHVHVPVLKVWFVVDAKGEPQSIKVMDPAFKRAANDFRKVIRTWRFDPGTCDGKRIPMALNPEILAIIPPLLPRN